MPASKAACLFPACLALLFLLEVVGGVPTVHSKNAAKPLRKPTFSQTAIGEMKTKYVAFMNEKGLTVPSSPMAEDPNFLGDLQIHAEAKKAKCKFNTVCNEFACTQVCEVSYYPPYCHDLSSCSQLCVTIILIPHYLRNSTTHTTVLRNLSAFASVTLAVLLMHLDT